MKTQNSIITAQALCEAFINNKSQAESKYGNRIMQVTGFAIHVGPDMFGLPSIELSENKTGPSRTICLLPLSDYLKLRNVSKGNEVTLVGEVRTIYEKGKAVVIKHCKIIEINKN